MRSRLLDAYRRLELAELAEGGEGASECALSDLLGLPERARASNFARSKIEPSLATTAFLPLLAAPLAREEALPPSRHQHLCVPWTASLREALTRSNAFLPDPAAFVSHPPVDAAAERLRRQLRRLGESCRAPFLPIGGTNAFGSHVNALVLPLKFAVASNRTMLTPPLGAYANGSCATLACFYRPLAPACERANAHPLERLLT